MSFECFWPYRYIGWKAVFCHFLRENRICYFAYYSLGPRASIVIIDHLKIGIETQIIVQNQPFRFCMFYSRFNSREENSALPYGICQKCNFSVVYVYTLFQNQLDKIDILWGKTLLLFILINVIYKKSN